MVGRHLFDKPRDVLYELARPESMWERQTAIVTTYYFVRQDNVTDTFGIVEMLFEDD